MSKSAACTLVLFALGASLFASAPARAEGKDSYVVIVHPDNPAKSLSKKKVSRLLLKELAKWDGGLAAQPVDLESGSVVRESFSQRVHGRSVSSIKHYWQRQVFSGRGVPPPELKGDDAVVSYVRSHPGAIGYVSPSAKLNGVKVVTLSSE